MLVGECWWTNGGGRMLVVVTFDGLLSPQMGGMEAVLTGIKDQFSGVINRYRYGREILTGVVCAFSFLVALQNVTYVSTAV